MLIHSNYLHTHIIWKIYMYIILLSFMWIINRKYRKNVNVNSKCWHRLFSGIFPLQYPLPSYMKLKDKYLPFSVAFSLKNVLVWLTDINVNSYPPFNTGHQLFWLEDGIAGKAYSSNVACYMCNGNILFQFWY